ncbi:hypothetical protein M0R45_035287 [Rubus argutus]|uniref:Disease resistance protein RPS4B/Roq1-like leucine-rich repeats domain-containing protein n=1 Tax=Rubus argutus TaxID=59490 RepID=A0AAW1VTR8_RUBAR
MKSLQELSLHGCSNLKKCPEFSEEMDELEDLSLAKTTIKEVPSSINNLTGLRNLYFEDGKELERLPSTIHMKSLQELSLYGCSNLKKCPEFSEEMDKLEYLSLDETAIKEVPSSINNLTGLRNLYFRDCKQLERLPRTIHMKSLQKLSLHGCSNLKKCPEFSEEMDKLEYLSLDETAIKEVPSSINNLTGLRNLYFRDCKQLERLPSTIHMKSLQKLSLHGCSNLKKCPEFSEEMDKLEYLSLDETAIKELPSSINNLTGLRNLYFRDCKELERLPSTIHMKSLQQLSLHGCSNLKKCPEFSEEMDKLEYLSLDETAIKELPSSINNLTGLRNLYFEDGKELERLPSTIHMKSLQELSLYGCSNLKKCPEFSEEMDKLEYLSLDETAIKEVPSSINNLTGLRNLYFRDCKQLERLPRTIHMKSLQKLSLHGCSNLKKCPEFSEEMVKLEYLSLDETAIKEVPSSINNLTGLRNLYFRDCKQLERLPSTIHMKSLQKLSLHGCSNLKKCPEFSEEMDKLEYLSLDETAIKELPSSINNLTGLRNLYFGDCKELERLPSTIHMKSLQQLSLHGCSNLKKCPEFSEEMDTLEYLSLDETAIKEVPSSINNLTGLRNLYFRDCKELERLPSTIHMKSLQELSLYGCSNFKKCPEFSEEMDKLEDLSLDETAIKEVPSSINNITGLRNLYFQDCKELERLPSTMHMKSLWLLNLHGCSNLKKCPEFSEEMDKLENLLLGECAIKEVPSSINNLKGLRNLDLRGCKELEMLPSTIRIKSLQILILSGCSSLKKCPEFSKDMEKLEELWLGECAIKEVPSSVNNLTGLRDLDLRGCRELERLPSCKAKIFCDQDKMPNLSNSCRTEVSFLNPCEMRNKETEEGRNIFTHCNCFLNKR